jgi:hypothetical protein
MKIKFLLIVFFLSQVVLAQVPSNSILSGAKEYSKDISLYRAKAFVMSQVIDSQDQYVQFEMDPLAASSSGELTSLWYNCRPNNKEGLILGFYNDYWNDLGVDYKGYAFKNLPKDKALDLLNKISNAIDEYKEYLGMNDDNNVYIKFEDITILLYKDLQTKIRVFWKGYDAEWQLVAFRRTLKRFDKKVN